MKKIITLLSFVLLYAATASAQYVNKEIKEIPAQNPFMSTDRKNHDTIPVEPICVQYLNGRILEFESNGAKELYNFQNAEINKLLEQENRLLTHRSTATIVSLSGSVVTTIGISIRNSNGTINNAGQIIATIGAFTTAGAAIWLLVNEFKLISTRRKINSYMQIVLFPTGLKVEF